jgi:hypothetical protein
MPLVQTTPYYWYGTGIILDAAFTVFHQYNEPHLQKSQETVQSSKWPLL